MENPPWPTPSMTEPVATSTSTRRRPRRAHAANPDRSVLESYSGREEAGGPLGERNDDDAFEEVEDAPPYPLDATDDVLASTVPGRPPTASTNSRRRCAGRPRIVRSGRGRIFEPDRQVDETRHVATVP